jgi:ribosomal protein L29
MKRNEVTKLKNQTVDELHKEVVILREKLWGLRREIAGGKVKNVKTRQTLRRDIARHLTVAHAKGLNKTK